MVRVGPERLGARANSKLHAKSIGLFTILYKIRYNAYILDLLDTLGISTTFNIQDLLFYHSPLPREEQPCNQEPNQILDKQTMLTKEATTPCYLVQWNDKHTNEDDWLTEDETNAFAPKVLSDYQSIPSL